MTIDRRRGAVRLRIELGHDVAIGPGKADLLEGVAETGSIAGAGRRLGMSYKRAWLLIDTMNRCFEAPLVHASRGGQSGGGARLTATGQRVLGAYRRAQRLAEEALAAELRELRTLVPGRPAGADLQPPRERH